MMWELSLQPERQHDTHVSYELLSKCSTKAAVVLKTDFVLVSKAMCSDTGFVSRDFISGGKFLSRSRAAKAK